MKTSCRNLTRESIIKDFKLREFKLSAQTALLGAVPPGLRAACVRLEKAGQKFEHDTIIGTFFFAGEISDDDSDSVDIAVTEIGAYFPQNERKEYIWQETEIFRIDYPEVMPICPELVYLRYEPGYESYRHVRPQEIFSDVNLVNLRLSAQRAFLGRITPEVRGISVEIIEQKIYMHFFYNDEISQMDRELAKLVVDDMKRDFFPSLEIEAKLQLLAYPVKLPNKGRFVYHRYEPVPEHLRGK